ncbi:MAG: PD-(D/E)XK nuclease family protein [Myxococcales bacterium FL481]|nr:MAG: PD-(D/E)XK nuclease family protein [Myxococcales bacterium FL481]
MVQNNEGPRNCEEIPGALRQQRRKRGAMIALSFSRIQVLRECPGQFRMRHVDRPRVEGEVSFPMESGRLAHDIFALNVSSHERTPDEMEEFARGYLDETRNPALIADVVALARKFAGRTFPDGTLAEHRLAFARDWSPRDWVSPDVGFRMILDICAPHDGYTEIRDFKTGWAKPTDEELCEDLQLPIYAYGALSASMAAIDLPVRLVWDYVRHHDIIEVELTVGTLQRARQEVDDAWDEVDQRERDDDWPFTPGPHCVTCPIRAKCPEVAKVRGTSGVAHPTRPSEAKRVARRLSLLRAAANVAEGALTRYVEARGPIPVGGGKAYGPHDVDGEQVPDDAGQIIDALKDMGLTADEILDALPLSKSSLEKACKALAPGRGKWKGLWSAAVEPHLERNGGTRTGFYKPK